MLSEELCLVWVGNVANYDAPPASVQQITALLNRERVCRAHVQELEGHQSRVRKDLDTGEAAGAVCSRLLLCSRGCRRPTLPADGGMAHSAVEALRKTQGASVPTFSSTDNTVACPRVVAGAGAKIAS